MTGGSRGIGKAIAKALTLSAIPGVVALDYVAFRLADLDLDTSDLAAWRAQFGARPSLETTLPQIELT